MPASDSILSSVKKSLGIQPDYDVFDPDIIMHINSTFSVLHQLGVGPATAFAIEDDNATWGDFLAEQPDLGLAMVQSYIYLKVRMLFDPPQASVLSAMKDQASEYEWRMNVEAETPA